MRFVHALLHFFTPRHTNNHRARALSTTSLCFYAILLILVQMAGVFINRFDPQILGYASNISINDLLRLTNDKRIENGTSTLVLNDNLSEAAQNKANDMFSGQYWAHTSPDGNNPWSFILDSGYTYLYAGENLARDFPDSKSVVDAWMNSATHKENLLNSKYREVGFAVVNGKYSDYETTLVVQMFGTRPASEPTVAAPQKPATLARSTSSAAIVSSVSPRVLSAKPVTTVFSLTKIVSIILTAMLIAVLAIDAFLVWKRGIIRISGHSFAHMMVLIVLLIILNVVNRGWVI